MMGVEIEPEATVRDQVSAVILALGIGLMIGFVGGVKASDVLDQVRPPTVEEIATQCCIGPD